ncbi:MAG: Stealth CR1 domain-containing protein [Bacteroidaceae bacterium]|nr:Stealth CR1 domain-containing protein [Bacteroidaceae bacterium]
MDIDFIITWVDGSDPEWLREKAKYDGSNPLKNEAKAEDERFRSFDNLQYLFRSIETFAPFVRKVHLVTAGHLPKWLNRDCPKLNIVKHSDYIPSVWLPTFSSRCIDMNFHRIEALAEHFVYFNDDFFLTNNTTPDFFFKDGLPCDAAVILSGAPGADMFRGNFWHAPMMCTSIINTHFNKKEVMKRNPSKWYNLQYRRFLKENIWRTRDFAFTGFGNWHMPYGYLKSTYEEVWKAEGDYLGKVSSHRFRDANDANHWIFTYWQYVTGQFTPRCPNYGRYFRLSDINAAKEAAQCIKDRKYTMVCINDSKIDDKNELKQIMDTVNTSLETLLPTPSSFEMQKH